jgi:hypothetical protein
VIFVCDEGVDRSIVEQLRADGHDVTYIAEISPSISDDEVLIEANDRGAVLVTADKDLVSWSSASEDWLPAYS